MVRRALKLFQIYWTAKILDNRFVIFFAGTFCDSYDFDTVFRATEKLININKTIKFVFAGKGEDIFINITYTADNSDSLVEQILYLVNNKEISRQMGINGRNTLESEFFSHLVYENFSKYIEAIGSTVL